MNIISIDIGSSTTKMILCSDGKIKSKKILRKIYEESDLEKFLKENQINIIDKIIYTGIGSDKIHKTKFNIPFEKVEEFNAIAAGGLYLSKKEKAIIASVGTGTALIEASKENIKHLGGSGVGAGTLFKICNYFLNINSFDEIFELAQKGNIEKIDLRIGDITDKNIQTLPKDLTLSNFGKFDKDAKKEDIVLGFVNMVFEVIGMMVAFASINSHIKDGILIGNITTLPGVKEMLKKIELTHQIKFTIPEDAEYGVALGAIICQEGKDFLLK